VTGGPTLNLADAARACGLSVSTLRRHRDALIAHGATRHDASWSIPISALIAAGLMPSVTPHDAPSSDRVKPVMTPHDDAPMTVLRDALADAEKRAAEAERRAAVAEAVATERERIIDAQAMALRLLEAPTATVNHPATLRPRRAWWPRRS
jgi:plasmid stability protein